MTDYFIHDGQKESGPFTLSQLSTQQISFQTPIWHKGLNGWTTAGALQELQPLLNSKFPPPFQTQHSVPPLFPQEEDLKETKSFSKVYWLAALILVAASVYWFVSASDNHSNPDISTSAELASIDPATSLSDEEIERQRINAEITAKNTNYRNNWNRYIWATNGNYKVSPLGGIYDLEVVITNDTEYVIDEVVVSVKYVKDNGAVYKTEPVSIYNVPAQGKASMPAPDSGRGTSVEMEITSMISRRMHFCYDSDLIVRGSEDPYFCKTR